MINLHKIGAGIFSDIDKAIMYGLRGTKIGIDEDGCLAYLGNYQPKWYFFKFESEGFKKTLLERWIKNGSPEPDINNIVSIKSGDLRNKNHNDASSRY